jgi:hypothetical protein
LFFSHELGRTHSSYSSYRPRVPKRATNTPARATILQAKVRRAAAAVWLFVIVGVADSLIGLVVASPARVHLHPLGTSWFVGAFYVLVRMAFEVRRRIFSGRQTKAVAADRNAQRVAGVVRWAGAKEQPAHASPSR